MGGNRRVKAPPSLQHLTSRRLEDLIRRATDYPKDPSCPELSALSEDQMARTRSVSSFAGELPAAAAGEMLDRVLGYAGDGGQRKATPMEAWVLVHPLSESLRYRRADPREEEEDPEDPFSVARGRHHRKRRPAPNLHKALLEALAHKCRHLKELDLSGMDDHSVDPDHNDLLRSPDCREHYLHVLESALRRLTRLASLTLGTLADNAILRAASETCGQTLREIRICGPAPGVTDLGVRYLVGQVRVPVSPDDVTADSPEGGDEEGRRKPSSRMLGCPNLRVLCLDDVERVSLSTLSLALLRLGGIRTLDHNFLHEALFLMHKTGKFSGGGGGGDGRLPPLKLATYNGRSPPQCEARYLEVLGALCPSLESLRLCASFDDTFRVLWSSPGFRGLRSLSIGRVATMVDFEMPLQNFGVTLVRLELTGVRHFQSGSALHIRRCCPNLAFLTLEIESTDAGGSGQGSQGSGQGAGDDPAAQAQGEQSVWALQNQVDDLQSRLSKLQVTMLGVMEKYGPMSRLEHLRLSNLSMGSLLILLPFAPALRTLSMKYREDQESSLADLMTVPNLTDELFGKIFQKNKFGHLESLLIWCRTLSGPTAAWFLSNCPRLGRLGNLHFWNLSDEEKVALWRQGKSRSQLPVEVEF